jgi:hypothetical protein
MLLQAVLYYEIDVYTTVQIYELWEQKSME